MTKGKTIALLVFFILLYFTREVIHNAKNIYLRPHIEGLYLKTREVK